MTALKYQNAICHLASIHKKERAIDPAFKKSLGCRVIPAPLNTDLLGTFTGEIERTLSPRDCAKEKCYRGLELAKGSLGVASEGSFGSHPSIPFVPGHVEILFFTDTNIGFELDLTEIFFETNFAAQSLQTAEELSTFAQKTLFPSHGLILRPYGSCDPELIFKGIQDPKKLHEIFQTCLTLSQDGLVRAETDMRAHMNPTRMKNIETLADHMATRLATLCPSCGIPGWGMVKKVAGLACASCHLPTSLIQAEIYGCCQCSHEQTLEHSSGLADPGQCPFCNP